MDGYCQEPWWNGNKPTSEGISLSPWHHSLIPGKVQNDGKAVGRLVLQSKEEGLDECAATRGLRRTFAERLLSVAGCSWEHWMTTWFVVVEKIIEQPLAESVELPFVGLLFPVPLLFTKKAMFRVFRVALRNQSTSWTRSISWSVPSWTRTLRSMRRWWHAWASSWKVGDVESQPE